MTAHVFRPIATVGVALLLVFLGMYLYGFEAKRDIFMKIGLIGVTLTMFAFVLLEIWCAP